MSPVLIAFGRAAHSLTRRGIFWHLLWPSLAALALWGLLAGLFWGTAAGAMVRMVNGWSWVTWLVGQWAGSETVAEATVHLLMFLLLLPLIYGTALLLAVAVAVPLMLERVAADDYAELERRCGGTLAGSVWNALVAVFWFVLAWVVTLPLWLVPGLALVIPLALSAYVNQRAYRYDALMAHADPGEMRSLIVRRKGGLFLVGLGAGALAYVPVVNLLAPSFAGLAFVHFCLEALRSLRKGVGRGR
ncbi:MAG: EI24 domain-containing protein [Betaproteobacteria bacterium]|nr:EI24 domain-containing protein [Betaproteobacteria bacterium]